MSTEPTLAELRESIRKLVDLPDGQPVRWRVVSIEYMGGVAPVCTASSYTWGSAPTQLNPEGPETYPTHRLDPEVFGPDARDDTGLYDCCPSPQIECHNDDMAAYLVALLNADAEAAGPVTVEVSLSGEQLADALRGKHRG